MCVCWLLCTLRYYRKEYKLKYFYIFWIYFSHHGGGSIFRAYTSAWNSRCSEAMNQELQIPSVLWFSLSSPWIIAWRSRSQSESSMHSTALKLYSRPQDRRQESSKMNLDFLKSVYGKLSPEHPVTPLWSILGHDFKRSSCSFSVSLPAPTKQICVGRKERWM